MHTSNSILYYLFFCYIFFQGLLRRLHSLYSAKASNSSKGSSVLPENNHEALNSSSKELNISKGYSEVLKPNYLPNGDNNTKQGILKLSRRIDPLFWWFRSINLRVGNLQLVITNGKIFLGCLMFLIYYLLRRKQATLKG